MLTNIEAVIFDLDGTLIDSMWVWNRIDEEYLGSAIKDFIIGNGLVTIWVYTK